MGIDYIDYEQALKIYHKTIDKSGGGIIGVRDEGGIKLMLNNVQNDIYYPEIADKAAYMMFSLCRGHYFNDCNKRISLTLTMFFFLQNGYLFVAQNFMKNMEEIVLDLAAGCMDRDLLTEIMNYLVNDEDYSESILLGIANARAKRLEIEKLSYFLLANYLIEK
ncbi:type II toxin-antitoxin system death-on-curing family toxin [Prevotella sp. OH937_COT-195]|uniref:type II toxin-antitoxin system death-on-curing family toxin n=1 Tax=Prevotella sp. OH937_COT-195 TaxID=2491051 RepID=UPI001F01D45D|nr:type II toxin-antitoxin system death-on-curing family toxin [Prevotella sp. OH937_COT-195]